MGTSEQGEQGISKPQHVFRQQRAGKAMNKLFQPNTAETSPIPLHSGLSKQNPSTAKQEAAQGSGGVPIPGGVQTPSGCGPWGHGL